MASLRLTFPEKDQPTVIALTGARLTIGRLPFNTIQIIDRTISGFHAELISEHGHYRLHDRGSSNGTYVNGQKVTDYHLSDACTISFGTVEAQFSPEDVAAVEEAETFPSRGEVNAVRQENAEMRATVSALREEIAALRQEHKASAEANGPTVSREEFEQVVVEREALKEAQLRNDEEIGRLKTDLAILKRDRVNLQFAYDGAQRELEQVRRKLNGEEDKPALPPVEAAAVVAAQADEVRIEVPKPPAATPSPSVPNAAPPPPAETKPVIEEPQEPLAPAASLPFKPIAKPPVPLSKAPGTPLPVAAAGQPAKPLAPSNLPHKPAAPPAANPAAVTTVIAKVPGVSGAGVRPLPRPPGNPPAPTAAPGAGLKPAAPNQAPTLRAGQRPLPAARPVPPPAAKVNAVPAPKVGPQGTQKLSE